jgi:hypothetical protein
MDRRADCDVLGRLVEPVRAGQSRALVVRGDPGVGKTVLLEYLAGRASGAGCRVARAAGVKSEMELAFAGLHQLCTPMLGRAERLPVPQREALRIAFGNAPGRPGPVILQRRGELADRPGEHQVKERFEPARAALVTAVPGGGAQRRRAEPQTVQWDAGKEGQRCPHPGPATVRSGRVAVARMGSHLLVCGARHVGV